MKRRNFLSSSILGGIGFSGLMKPLSSLASPLTNKGKAILRVGICADLHQDIVIDAPARLQAFITEMNQLKPDFIIQMGDLCVPKPTNQVIMDTWNQFKGPKYHVIGNHDTDGGYTHDQVINFWGAKDKYYSFDANGYHFVVLNANEEKSMPNYKGSPSIVTQEQRNWLEQDLAATKLPVIVFCHQGLDNDTGGGVYEGNLVRVIFDRANAAAKSKKVQLVFSGHHHQDYYNVINGVHYVQINSMSYQWMGEKYAHAHYDEATEKAHPGLKYIAPYKDPIWALLTIYSNGVAEIKGRQSVFLPPSPDELHRPAYHSGYPDVPYISNRTIQL